MRESRILRNLRLGWEFPYGGARRTYTKRFRGDNRLLYGYVEKTGHDIHLGQGDTQVDLLKSTPYLEMHFYAKNAELKNGKPNKTVKTMRRGAEDLLDLADAITKKKKLQEIDIFVGTTNDRMANIAVRQLGFHYGNPGYVESRKKRKKGKINAVTIYITREELLAKEARIKEIKKLLTSREK